MFRKLILFLFFSIINYNVGRGLLKWVKVLSISVAFESYTIKMYPHICSILLRDFIVKYYIYYYVKYTVNN
jgi:hypothetical protein